MRRADAFARHGRPRTDEPQRLELELKLSDPQIFGGSLAVATTDQFVADACPLGQTSETGLLNRRDVNENVHAASLRFDEAIALGLIEKFYCPHCHVLSPPEKWSKQQV